MTLAPHDLASLIVFLSKYSALLTIKPRTLGGVTISSGGVGGLGLGVSGLMGESLPPQAISKDSVNNVIMIFFIINRG